VKTQRLLLSKESGWWWVECLAFSADGRRLFACAGRDPFCCWDVDTGAEIHVSDLKFTSSFFALSADEHTIVGSTSIGKGAIALPDGFWYCLPASGWSNENCCAITGDGRLAMFGLGGVISGFEYRRNPSDANDISVFEIPTRAETSAQVEREAQIFNPAASRPSTRAATTRPTTHPPTRPTTTSPSQNRPR
jgi:hypothetical protein